MECLSMELEMRHRQMRHNQDLGSESDYDPDELLEQDWLSEPPASPIWRVSIAPTRDATMQTSASSSASDDVMHQTPSHSPTIQESAFGITPPDTPGMLTGGPPPQVEQNLVLDLVGSKTSASYPN
eukprot:12889646-Prorocentrum_lima.AAC.1